MSSVFCRCICPRSLSRYSLSHIYSSICTQNMLGQSIDANFGAAQRDEMYFYCRTYTQSTDRKLRKPETDDVSIRAASGYALIASISTSTSTSGRDRFFPSAEPKKPASRTRARTRVRHTRSALSSEKWRNKNGLVRKAAKMYARFFCFRKCPREHFGTCRGSRREKTLS